MRKWLLVTIFAILCTIQIQAQEKFYHIYLPIITINTPYRITDMECKPEFGIIKPIESYNYVLNPSAETTGNYSAFGFVTVDRATDYHEYGSYSYYIYDAQLSGLGINLTLSELSNISHYVSFAVKKPYPQLYTRVGGIERNVQFIYNIDSEWDLVGVQITNSESSGETTLSIRTLTKDEFYIDGVQVEPLPYQTTYIDGTQSGCKWIGTEHASASIRNSQSRDGGRVLDLFNEYGFFVERIVGGNNTSLILNTNNYAVLPGGELNGIKENARNFTLIGHFISDTKAGLHKNKRELAEILSNSSFPNNQPIRIRYNGSSVQKEISAFYNGGLEGDFPIIYNDKFTIESDKWLTHNKFSEIANIQFLAPSPFWVEVGESAEALDVEDAMTFGLIASRTEENKQWDNLDGGLGGAGIKSVFSIELDANNNILYAGGDFTNYISSWDGSSWSTLGAGVNSLVRALVMGANELLYVGGGFTTAGGGAANRIASWDGSSWAALSTGTAYTVYALAIGLDGTLYAGGNSSPYISSWDGSSWSTLGSAPNGTIYALAIGLDGTLYAGGTFTTIGGISANYIASWDGSSWSALGAGLNNEVYSLAIDKSGNLYAGGLFTTAGGISANYIALWNGTNWNEITDGLNSRVYAIGVVNNNVYVGGLFTDAGGISSLDRIGRWNGSTWANLDVLFVGTPTIYSIKVNSNDLYIGLTTTSLSSDIGGLITVDNEGNQPVYPIIKYIRSGGTSATIATLRNETTGKELLFDYDLLDGETLTIDLTPTSKSITSSFFGSRLDAVLPNSDFGDFTLQPGSNDITSFVINDGATITATMQWKELYKGID